MVLLPEEELKQKSIRYAKENRTKIANRLTNKNVILPERYPVSVFMCGSPGAGKTETSKALVEHIEDNGTKVLRLDPDDLRNEFEDYDGSNSYIFQSAVSLLVERTLDKAFQKKQSFLLDGTLSHLRIAQKNIERSLNKGRSVLIIFVYQRPELAWEFVKAREIVEGRRILPHHFVEQFFGCQNVIKAIKEEYGRQVKVDLIIKDSDGQAKRYEANISSLEPYIKPLYTLEEVNEIVRDT